MNIDELLNRYFEGETSAEEEQKLRRFFASDNVPENLSAYKPLFAYFDEEIAAERDMAEEIWSEIAPEALPEKVTVRIMYWQKITTCFPVAERSK